MKKRWFGIVPVLILSVLSVLIYNGTIQMNRPSPEAFPVRGADVSHYQGNVDWTKLQKQGVMFAYIKATEGSSYKDSAFQANWEGAPLAGIRGGAYHFFSFESPGLNQAENFIGTVSAVGNMLPPAVDVEPYGQYKTVRDIAGAASELRNWLDAVEAEYGMHPVIYTTESFYRGMIAAEFPDYDIWIRSVFRAPSKSVRWKFWQYSDRVRLDGYDGEERFIDMNAFRGTIEEFEKYGK